jgi:hypothetical protein
MAADKPAVTSNEPDGIVLDYITDEMVNVIFCAKLSGVRMRQCDSGFIVGERSPIDDHVICIKPNRRSQTS